MTKRVAPTAVTHGDDAGHDGHSSAAGLTASPPDGHLGILDWIHSTHVPPKPERLGTGGAPATTAAFQKELKALKDDLHKEMATRPATLPATAGLARSRFNVKIVQGANGGQKCSVSLTPGGDAQGALNFHM